MQPLDSILYDGALVRLGLFRCPREHPRFHDTGPIQGWIIVFPRTAVTIAHPRGRPIATGPNLVMFYNRGQVYRRDPISPSGDRCDWFGFAPQAIASAIRAHRPDAEPDPAAPFPWTHAASSPQLYLAQRRLIDALIPIARSNDLDTDSTSSGGVDSLAVEERALHLLDAAVQQAFGAPRLPAAQPPRGSALARAVAARLAADPGEKHTLPDLARAIGSSPFSLARCFRAEFGNSIHRSLDQLRLRLALGELAGCSDLARLATDLGYATHGHFTTAFHRNFGLTPSRYRTLARSQRPATT